VRALILSSISLLALVASRTAAAAPPHGDDDHDDKKHDESHHEHDATKSADEDDDHEHKHLGDRPRPNEATEVVIEGEKPGSEAASRVTLGRRELELRPRLRPGDIVEAVPGLFAVQHAGGGKAEQFYLRGFDADHGTDVAFSVDGIPVNLPSHGHGQGFADLHFLIPELVVGLDGYKGTFYASQGDFATAGAVNMKLAEKFDESYAQYSIGQYGIMRGLAIASPDLGDSWRAVLAAELYKDDGPFVNPEQLKRFNLYFKLTHDLGQGGKLSATWMSYGSTWHGSGQIPARAVCNEGEAQNPGPETFNQPCIDHFGNVDPTEGGATQRHIASLAYEGMVGDSQLSAMAYVQSYRFDLFSNFTFFAEDPVHGDEIEQTDSRFVAGIDTHVKSHFHIGEARFQTTLGAQVRVDSIDNALYHDEARERLETKVAANVQQSAIGVYGEEEIRLRRWIKFTLGARAQRMDVSVEDKNEDLTKQGNKSSGAKGASLLLPKASVVVSPIPELDLFGSFGRGFHSNDARGVVRADNPATLLTPARGYEIGVRARPIKGLSVSAAGFLIDLDSELVWSGDAGDTEASGQTRRFGLELDARYHLSNWLFADADATFTRARYTSNAGNGSAVALAPTRTFSAGIGVRPTVGDFTPYASARVKSIGSRPATEDESLTAEGFTVVDADAGVRWKNIEAGLDVQNLLDATWREVQFATETRLAYEPKPVTGIHYSPGWPRTVMAKATLYWQ
jgi:outer membrane receptor protein involved in Fe transport